METNHEREQQGRDQPRSATPFPIPSRIPVFPLPNVVLFPKTYLPLHIFGSSRESMGKNGIKITISGAWM